MFRKIKKKTFLHSYIKTRLELAKQLYNLEDKSLVTDLYSPKAFYTKLGTFHFIGHVSLPPVDWGIITPKVSCLDPGVESAKGFPACIRL